MVIVAESLGALTAQNLKTGDIAYEGIPGQQQPWFTARLAHDPVAELAVPPSDFCTRVVPADS